MSNIINHIRTWYNMLRSLPPDVRDAAIGAIDRIAYFYQQFPPNESDAEYESRMMNLDKTLDDALDAMEESMKQKQPIIKQVGSSRKRVRKQFKKSKSKYTTRRRQ